MTEPKSLKGIVYILKSQKTGSYYVGSTNDLTRRIGQHGKGQVKATKFLLPMELCFFQEYKSLKLARSVEYRIKRLKRKDFLDRMIKEGQILLKLRVN